MICRRQKLARGKKWENCRKRLGWREFVCWYLGVLSIAFVHSTYAFNKIAPQGLEVSNLKDSRVSENHLPSRHLLSLPLSPTPQFTALQL